MPALFLVAAILAGIALMVVYALGGQTQIEGVLLFVALGGIGAGMVSWAKRFMTTAPETEPRPRLGSTDEEIDAFSDDFDQGEYELERRTLLTKLLLGALGALGLAALFPIASLGPPARKSFRTSPYKKGMRLVTENGEPVRADSVNVNGVITVFPEHDVDDEFAQVVLIGLDPQREFTPRAGREDWTPHDLVAFSKVCTHAGCPVGLYEAELRRAALPVPPVDVRRVRRRPARLRPGRDLPSAAPARHRRRRLRDRRRRALGPAGTVLLEPAVPVEGRQPVTDAPVERTEMRNRAGRLGRWIDARIGLARVGRTALQKIFPNHWSFLLGEVALYSFLVLLLTGIYLTFFYDRTPTSVTYHGSYVPLQGVEMSKAYRSSLDLSFDVKAGLVVRQIHHWAALIFLGAIVVHLCRVFFTGAFRRPRELNWVVGCTLLLLGVLNGFAGYSLLDDQLSGTGLRIGYSVLISVPFVGPWLALAGVRRATSPATDIIPRLFVVHILIVPLAIIGAHHGAPGDPDRAQAHPLPRPRRPRRQRRRRAPLADLHVQGRRPLLPGRGGRSRCSAAIAQINPVWLYGPFRPENVIVGVAARLVHGLARRRAAAHAELGDAHRWLHHPQPVLRRRAPGWSRVHGVVRVALDRSPPHQGPP